MGSHLGAGLPSCLDGVTETLVAALDRAEQPCPILLENTAGGGGTIGRSLAELASVIDAATGDPRLGVCLDTQHLWASGVDFTTPEAALSVRRVTTSGEEAAGEGRVEGCELCEAARMTAWHHEDDLCWVADCEACDVPMVVWRRHGASPPEADVERMLGQLTRVATALFGADGFHLDTVMRQIPDHFHAHARDANWWGRRRSATLG